MISMSHEATSNTTMFSDGQGFLYPLATLRTILRRELRRYFPDSTTGAFSLVFEYQNESPPRCVTDGLGKVMVFYQSFYVQIFYGYLVKFLDELVAEFMEKIAPLVPYLEMFFGKNSFCFLTIRATQFLLTYFALLNFQFTFCFAKVLWILYHLASRKRGKIFNANIYTDIIARLRNEATLILFNREDDKPAIGLAFNGTSSYLTFNYTREADTRGAYLRKRQLIIFEAESFPSVSERIKSVVTFKSWIAGFVTSFAAAKERLERFIQIPQRVISNHAIDGSHVLSNFSHFRQFFGLIKIENILFRNPPSITAFLQASVVNFTANLKRPLALSNEFLIRFKLEFIGFH